MGEGGMTTIEYRARRTVLLDTAIVGVSAIAIAVTALAMGVPAWVIPVCAAGLTAAVALPIWLVHQHADRYARDVARAAQARRLNDRAPHRPMTRLAR
jgi:hypothetical protein